MQDVETAITSAQQTYDELMDREPATPAEEEQLREEAREQAIALAKMRHPSYRGRANDSSGQTKG